jgi:hypothetical protein
MPDSNLQRAAAVAALALALALVAAPVGAAQAPTTRLDATGLGTDAAVQTYEADDVVAVEAQAVDATLTVADSADEVNLSGLNPGELTTTYLRVDYDEGVERRLRIVVPSEYVTPRPSEDIELLASSGGPEPTTADFTPGPDGETTVVTLTVGGPADVVVPFSELSGTYWSVRRPVAEGFKNATGFEVPSFVSGTPWRYVDPGEYGDNRTATFNASASDLTLQYETAPDESGETDWLTVPDCTDPAEQRVCYYEENNETHVMTTESDPPRLRYKHGTDPIADLRGAINDLMRIPERVSNVVDSITGLF